MPCSIIAIIPLFLFIMLLGAVLIYLNFKIMDIKREVDKQNKILLSFISDIKSNLLNNKGLKFPGAGNGGGGDESLASDGALAFVNKIVACDLACGMPVFSASGKDLLCNSHMDMNIALESFSSDDDSDSDDSDESISLVIEVSDVELPVPETVSLPNIVLTDITDVSGVALADVSDITDIDVGVITGSVIRESNNMSEVIDYNNMKVEQLRKVVLEKLLAPNKEVNKMKKTELLALMSRNK